MMDIWTKHLRGLAKLEEKAKRLATEWHSSIKQVRKYTGEPYINHPAAVVEIVRSVPHTGEMLAAAWLHDTVEDTDATLDEIHDMFGHHVADMVEMLTDVSKPEDGNRAKRKAIDRAHSARGIPAAKTIKIADLIDNSSSILERDPRFAEVFIREKALLLKVLKEGDLTLWNRANNIVLNHINQW